MFTGFIYTKTAALASRRKENGARTEWICAGPESKRILMFVLWSHSRLIKPDIVDVDRP